MRYSKEFIEKVVSAISLVDVISQYTLLKPAGRSLVGRCPFPDHQEKTPSFHVSPDKQVYHCFGCKKGGNVFTFLEQFQGMNFVQALEYLAQKASIPLPVDEVHDRSKEIQDAKKRKELLEINRIAAQFFSENFNQLPEGNPVKLYAHHRHLKSESIQLFQLGYASSDWDGLVNTIRKKGLSLDLAEDLGLIKRRESGGFFDLFRERLMFAITNQMGEVIGFGGRILGEGNPKYINSPDSVLFHKGKSLYGIQHSSRYIRSKDYVIVVEGYMDLISLYQSGFCNVVAPLGTALTAEQCRQISKMTKNVVILFDGDSAGQMAAERSLPILLEAGLYPKGLVLPEEMDPDEFLLSNSESKMAELIKSAPDLFTLIFRKWLEEYSGGATDKIRLIQKASTILNSIKNNALKELYLRDVAYKMSVDLTWVRRAILGQDGRQLAHGESKDSQYVPTTSNSSNLVSDKQSPQINNQNNLEVEDSVVQKIGLKGASKWELIILALIMSASPEVREQILQAEEIKLLTHTGIQKVFKRVETLSRQSGLPSDNLFVLITNEILDPELVTGLINELPVGDHEGEARLLADCFRKVRIHDLDLRIKQLAQKLKNSSDNSSDTSNEYWSQLAELHRDRLRWLNPNH